MASNEYMIGRHFFTMNQRMIDKTISDITSIYEELSSAENLCPKPVINENFSRLVHIVDTIPKQESKEILQHKKVSKIIENFQNISSRGEFELEHFWVQKILESDDVWKSLESFPYYDNYVKIADFESAALKACNVHTDHKILFVGSGPLPLSSIVLNKNHGFAVDNVDIDKEACRLSKNLINKLNLSHPPQVFCKDIFNITDFSSYDCIIVAALVGKNDQEKEKIIEHITRHVQKHTHIALRSSCDLGVLLYPRISLESLRTITIKHEYGRSKGVINTLVMGSIK